MTTEDVGRLAFSAILGAILAIAITKPGLDMGAYVLRFVIFAVAAGIIVNTTEKWRLAYLVVASAMCTVAVMGTLLWIALIHHGVIASLSSVRLDFHSEQTFALQVLAVFSLACFIGVLLGALARPVTVDLLQRLLSVDLAKAKRIEAFLNVLVGISGTLAMLYFSWF
jgi:hypothetical protein